MSEITARPKVKAIIVTCLPATGDGVAPAVVDRATLRQFVASIDHGLAERFDALPATHGSKSEATALPVAQHRQLAAERAVLTSMAGQVPPLAAMKLSVLSGIESGGFVTTPVDLRAPLESLLTATSVAVAEQARGVLIERLHTSHLSAIITAATAACSDSSQALGFDRVTVEARGDGQRRAVATDDAGRVLVSEITVVGREVQVETEVVGVRDGSCHGLLDQFDAHLEARGVVGDRSRRTTGGFCQLAAAKSLFEPLTKGRDPGRTRDDVHRRVNTKPVLKKQGTR